MSFCDTKAARDTGPYWSGSDAFDNAVDIDNLVNILIDFTYRREMSILPT
jgi:hypothetical protein